MRRRLTARLAAPAIGLWVLAAGAAAQRPSTRGSAPVEVRVAHRQLAGTVHFRVRDDGTLEYLHKVDVETTPGSTTFWMNTIAVPRR